MSDQTRLNPKLSLFRRMVVSVARSLISTMLIILVATGVFVFRRGFFVPRMLWEVTVENAPLFAGIFVALVIWNLTFVRRRAQ